MRPCKLAFQPNPKPLHRPLEHHAWQPASCLMHHRGCAPPSRSAVASRAMSIDDWLKSADAEAFSTRHSSQVSSRERRGRQRIG